MRAVLEQIFLLTLREWSLVNAESCTSPWAFNFTKASVFAKPICKAEPLCMLHCGRRPKHHVKRFLISDVQLLSPIRCCS
ncbi:hypothetical protein EUGRSUZ_E03573 [Eucalyptus grandis]|uniref:Uncharacterized protein n=2 Tax=Eucalyptus grandis TaxID=71139 RepID=A0ACC3KZ70_EUCGR|nr:hypothetical protein EUGRSUZ_E03573 [Eucalyptus grandis]